MRSREATAGLEIVETFHLTHAFKPHRHDCYVVGITTHGVQSFGYRREDLHALPGQAFVIHPDETHDGRPGTEQGYGYRAAYVAPSLIGDALEGRSLPFIDEAVSQTPELLSALTELLCLNDFQRDEITASSCITQLADALAAMSGGQSKAVLSHRKALLEIRERLCSEYRSGVRISELEATYGLSRHAIARMFRRHFGVSPHRFIIMRRLDHTKSLIRDGTPLAEAAHAAGFADQSHMTRHFVGAFGFSPAFWKRILI